MRLTFFVLVAAVSTLSQGRPQVQVSGLLESDVVHAGKKVHAAVSVKLPKGYHVNSNQPLDKYLIPTTLSLELPLSRSRPRNGEGVTYRRSEGTPPATTPIFR